MTCSEARLNANRLNAAKSSGPKTPEGKAISRRNGLKHGLTGEGIVVPEGDQEEIDRRVEALTSDMKPGSPAALLLIIRMATLSVRTERSAEQESAAIAHRVRHAAEDFDEARIELAKTLFEALADDPRGNLRKLRRSPEGVDRLIDAWRDLQSDLAANPEPIWTASQMEQAANLAGFKAQHARSSRIGALSRGFWGDFAGLGDSEGGGLDDSARRGWAKAALFALISDEIAGLERHRETLDFEMIEIDRAEAGARALFDPSKPAILARRYESEADRGFYKALKEFRLVEAESLDRAEAPPTPPAPSLPEPEMGSSWEPAAPPVREPSRSVPDAPLPAFSVALDRDGQPLRVGRPFQSPG